MTGLLVAYGAGIWSAVLAFKCGQQSPRARWREWCRVRALRRSLRIGGGRG